MATPTRVLVRVLLTATCALSFMLPAWAADYVVVANAGVPGGVVSRDDLKAIFLGEKTSWGNGAPVRIVVLEEGPAHKAFVQDVLGKTPAQFDSFWKKLVFSGKAGAPKSFADPAALAAYVAKEPGAIGYVSPGTPTGSAKTMKVD